MKISVKVKLNTFRATSLNLYPLVIQIIYKRHKKLIYSPFYLTAQEWNEERCRAVNATRSKKRSPLVQEVNLYVEKQLGYIEDVVRSLEKSTDEFFVEDIIEMYRRYSGKNYLTVYMDRLVGELRREERVGTSYNYRSTLNSLRRFLSGRDILFEDFDYLFIKDFEMYLRRKKLSENTVYFYIRILRAVYNKAVNEGLFVQKDNPFKKIKIKSQKTLKRAIDKQIIKKIIEFPVNEYPSLEFSRDLFLFSFYTRGMSFVDMAFLNSTNIISDRIIYARNKTKQLLQIKITPPIRQIIDKYHSSDKYLLPIIKKTDESEYEQYRNALRIHNRKLQKIGEVLSVPARLTSYVSRHSWATIAKNNGIPVSVISECLGHNSERTTYIYLGALDSCLIDKANDVVTNF